MAAKKRNYKKEYNQYHGKPGEVKRRSERNQARRKMEQSGQVSKGDNKDVHHKDGNTANNSTSNLSVTTRRYNRGTKNRKK